MKQFHWSGNFLVWAAIEIAAMAVVGSGMSWLVSAAGQDVVGHGISYSTVLLSVAVAIVIQLWVKLNDLSALSSLSIEERRRLWSDVRYRVRALVWLVIFFVAFIFFVLAASAVSAAQHLDAVPVLIGVGAGFGASIVLIAGVLVDLNEIAQFRWAVETSDYAKQRHDAILEDLRKSQPGFENDENIQGYKRVSNGD